MKKEKKKKNLLITTETLKQSILKDSFMTILTLVSFYINYKFIGNNIFLNGFLFVGLIGFNLKLFDYVKFYEIDKKQLKKIKKIIKEKNKGTRTSIGTGRSGRNIEMEKDELQKLEKLPLIFIS